MYAPESTFTRGQMLRYFEHIRLPKTYHPLLDYLAQPDPTLLRDLHVHHIASIPYENLSLHYAATKDISLDPQQLYDKFIDRGRNRGGYCMESALFFLHILRGLGFDAYPTGARIRLRKDGVPTGSYVGLVHIVLIVTFPSGERFASDVAFGGDGPTVPLRLSCEDGDSDASGNMTRNLGSQEVRLIREGIPQMPARASIGGRQEFWIYQYRNSSVQPWNSFYCFAETEFLETDFTVMNFFTSQGKTFQRVMVMVVKFILDEDALAGGHSRISGKLMLVDGTIKRNLGGRTEIVQICRTEEERVDALASWFGIKLTEDEVKGIKGEVTELTGSQVVAA